MGIRTQTKEEMFEAGKRVKECRLLRGLSREELVEKIELLPDNHGKDRSVKQLSYIETGARKLSKEYAFLLSQALNIRVEYFLLKDNYKTEIERIGASTTNRNEKRGLILDLIKLHFYEVKDATQEMPIKTDDRGNKYQEPTLKLISPRGSIRYFSHKELLTLINQIDDYIEMQCAFQFRKLREGTKNIYDWEV